MRRKAFGLTLGAALLCLPVVAGAQKAADPMLGVWRVAGQNVLECMLSTPTGTMEVLRPTGDGAYAVRLATTWRREALPNCPAPEEPAGEMNVEGTLRRAGSRLTLEVVLPDGQRGGPWTYELEQGGGAMRFICPECIKTTFRWERSQ